MKYTQEELHQMFEYRDGDLYWKIEPLPQRRAQKSRGKVGDKANKLHADSMGNEFSGI